MKKTVIALCASLLVNLINPAGLKAWGWTELVVSNGKKQAEMIQAEQTGERDSLSVQVQAPCAVLMEASTGQTIYEKNADERRSPASITKIMTLILIFDAIDAGKIRLSDEVVTSAHAKSMGGSQVFLEEGEVQTVETLIKCIVIASGNDASVAMAEYIAGCGLLRPDGITGASYHSAGYCYHVPGTDYKISADPCVFHNLDGEHYPCDKTGNEGIWAFQYQ